LRVLKTIYEKLFIVALFKTHTMIWYHLQANSTGFCSAGRIGKLMQLRETPYSWAFVECGLNLFIDVNLSCKVSERFWREFLQTTARVYSATRRAAIASSFA